MSAILPIHNILLWISISSVQISPGNIFQVKNLLHFVSAAINGVGKIGAINVFIALTPFFGAKLGAIFGYVSYQVQIHIFNEPKLHVKLLLVLDF